METNNTITFWDKAYNSALQMAKFKLDVQDQFWAEDIAQNAVVKAFLQFEKFDNSKGSFITWLLVITKNLCFDFSKRKEKTLMKKVDLSLFSNVMEIEFDEILEREKKYVTLEKCLGEIKTNERKIIEMKYFKNASSREISCETNIPEGNVPMYMKRAKKKLQNKIRKYSA